MEKWKYKGLFATEEDALQVVASGSGDDLVLVGTTLYFYDTNNKKLSVFLKDSHYKGSYDNLNDVYEKYMYGCVSGDFVSIDGYAYFWNSDLNGWSDSASLAVEDGTRAAEVRHDNLPEVVAKTLTNFRGIFTSLDDATLLMQRNGAEGDFVSYGRNLYVWDNNNQELKIYPASFRYRGTYEDMQVVESVFPTGGVAGQYVVIDSKAYLWSADKVRWVYGTAEESLRIAKEVLTLDKDVLIKGSATVEGDINVSQDATVGGTLNAKKIVTELADKPEKAGKGIYSSGAAYKNTPTHIGVDASTQNEDGIVDLTLRNADDEAIGAIAKLYLGLSSSDKNSISESYKSYIDNAINALTSKFLSRLNDDTAAGKIKLLKGLESLGEAIFQGKVSANGEVSFKDILRSVGFVRGISNGKGWCMDKNGNLELESLTVRSFIEVIEILVNRIQGQEGDTVFAENDKIESLIKNTLNGIDYYTLNLKEKWEGYFTAQNYGNILKGTINTLAAKQAGVSDYSSKNVEYQSSDVGGNKYYTSWMRVVETQNAPDSAIDSKLGLLGKNQIRVVLYGDTDTPANRNFEPCEQMTIVRNGCIPYGDENDTALQESIRKRQQVFYISTSEGRIVKLTGVNKPILEEGNYGTVLGTIPDFIKGWDSWGRLVKEHPHLNDRDYLYTQGLIYEDLVHVDIKDAPVPVTVDCTTDWVDGAKVKGQTVVDEYGDTVDLPTIKYGKYFNVGWNPKSNQFERHVVRHNNGRWLCLQNQPVVIDGVEHYYEPKWNSPYWRLIDGNGNLSIEFTASNGASFRSHAVNTVITPFVYYGNVPITDDLPAECFTWTRSLQTPSEDSKKRDEAWNKQHVGIKELKLTNEDMDGEWTAKNKQIFTLTVKVNDGKNERIVDNQVIS